MATRKKSERGRRKRSAVRRLLIANAIALLVLWAATVITLACLGLLGSIFAFIV